MILLNFAQAITEYQKAQIFALTNHHIHRLIDIPCRIYQHQPLLQQIVAVADAAGLSLEQWQSEAILINPPVDSVTSAALIAQLYRIDSRIIVIYYLTTTQHYAILLSRSSK